MAIRRIAFETRRRLVLRELANTVRPLLAANRAGRPITLEVCSGHGHFLTDHASAHPSNYCIGLDYCRARIARARRKQERHHLSNLAFVCGSAADLLEVWPAGVLVSQIIILFPDPWPKRRHRKYRVVSKLFLDRIAQISVGGAQFYFRTDSNDYFAEVLGLLNNHAYWTMYTPQQWPFEPSTVFQDKIQLHQSLVAIRTPRSL